MRLFFFPNLSAFIFHFVDKLSTAVKRLASSAPPNPEAGERSGAKSICPPTLLGTGALRYEPLSFQDLPYESLDDCKKIL
jgi:hypothetical protein